MRPIKFCGRDLDGKLRYGFYAEHCGYPYIIENHTWHEAQSDSVQQLVGYDANGREVYEGDTLIATCALIATCDIGWTAELVHAPVSDDGFQLIVAPEKFTLKED